MALTTTSQITKLITQAYDKEVALSLRSQPVLSNFAVKRPVDVSHSGSSIKLQIMPDMAPATTPLAETATGTPTSLADNSEVIVTVQEYGNTVSITNRLAVTSLANVDRMVAQAIAYNQIDSLDKVCTGVAITGSNRVASNAGVVATKALGSLTSSDVFKSALPRYTVAKLRGGNAAPLDAGLYTAVIHPDVAHDFRTETGATGWREIHNFSGATQVWNADLGVYEGVRYIESPRAYSATDGSSSARVYRTLVFGQDALVEAIAQAPSIVIGPQVDPLERISTIGWKAFLGYSVYRQEALYRIETGSSIA